MDHSVFFRRSKDEHTIIAVVTDDMAVTSKRAEDVTKFKSELKRHFEIADGSELHWFLGFKITQDRAARTISINQRNHIERMVDRLGPTNAKPVATSMEPGTQFGKDQSPLVMADHSGYNLFVYVLAIL